MKLKVITVVGTRPEIIRLSRIIPKLDAYFDHVIINTMQNSHKSLNEVFFKDLRIRKPDYFLEIRNDNTGNLIGDIIANTYSIFANEKPDCLLILGDTNSSLCAICAKHLKIPIFHMESGNRSFDINLPEEINRKIIDEISDINMPYSDRAKNNLLLEGKSFRSIFKTGSPLYEVLNYYMEDIKKTKIMEKLNLVKDDYFLISIHRNENTSSKEKIEILLKNIESVSKRFNKKVIFSFHPRTKDIINRNGIKIPSSFVMSEPFGFFEYIQLQMNSFCVISDSGSLAEESCILNFKAVSLRDSTERQESLEFSNFTIANLNEDGLINAIEIKLKEAIFVDKNNDYFVDNVSGKVVNIIQSYAKIARKK